MAGKGWIQEPVAGFCRYSSGEELQVNKNKLWEGSGALLCWLVQGSLSGSLFGCWLVVFCLFLFFLSSTQLPSDVNKVLLSFPTSLQVRKLSQRFRDQRGVRAEYRLLALQPCVVIGAWIF